MKNIEHLVDQLYKKYGTCNPFRLCGELGISYFFLKMPSKTNGLYYQISGEKVILINQDLNETESRITAAHELGHALLHPETNSLLMSSKTNLETGRFERQANYFATCLLLSSLRDDPGFKDLSCESLSAITGLDIEMIRFWCENHLDFE